MLLYVALNLADMFDLLLYLEDLVLSVLLWGDSGITADTTIVAVAAIYIVVVFVAVLGPWKGRPVLNAFIIVIIFSTLPKE